MTLVQLRWFFDLFEETGVAVWLDGGWGVDALLGEQTRPHSDLDIMISSGDSPTFVAALKSRGFIDVDTDDRTLENFAMRHDDLGQIDFHVFEQREDGSAIYKPGIHDWVITADEFAGVGSIAGRPVRCFTAEYQVRSHANYELKHSDAHDLKHLRVMYGVRLTSEQTAAINKLNRPGPRIGFEFGE